MATCIYCGQEFAPPKPTTTMCQFCWYGGVHHEAVRADLMYALRAIRNIDSATVDHTGGGCFGLAVRLADGRFLFATEAYFVEESGRWDHDAGVPAPGGHWALGIYSSEEGDEPGGFRSCEGAMEDIRLPLTDEELIAAVREITVKE